MAEALPCYDNSWQGESLRKIDTNLASRRSSDQITGSHNFAGVIRGPFPTVLIESASLGRFLANAAGRSRCRVATRVN